jgi:hypothetical protein
MTIPRDYNRIQLLEASKIIVMKYTVIMFITPFTKAFILSHMNPVHALIKFTLEQAMKAQRGSRVMTLLFL